MIYDSSPGSSYTPTITILDSNGSPVESGIVGTMTLYGPASATALSGPTSLSHFGAGAWGVTFAGSNFAALGTYRWATSAITGTATIAAQAGTFVVGQGDLWTLRELYTSVRRTLRDGWTGRSTGSGSTTTLVDARRAYGANNDWVGSELFLFEPQSLTDLNPLTVTAFTASSGTFTFTGQAITSTVSGLDYILGNKDGQGWAHDEVIDAITVAIRRTGGLRRVTDQVSITTAFLDYEYSIPLGWARVDSVEYQPWGIGTEQWLGIGRPYAPYDPARGVLTLTSPPPNNTLRIRGWAVPALPAAMGALVHGSGPALRDDAVYELLKMSSDTSDRQRAAMMAPAVERARAGAALARL